MAVAAKKLKRVKHIPQRTCVGCRQVLPKRNLIRIVRTDNRVVVDPTGKQAGRGAYLHDEKSCWVKALKGSLASALHTTIEEQDLEALERFMASLPNHESDLQEQDLPGTDPRKLKMA